MFWAEEAAGAKAQRQRCAQRFEEQRGGRYGWSRWGVGGALVFLSEVRVTQSAFHCNVKAAVWDR